MSAPILGRNTTHPHKMISRYTRWIILFFLILAAALATFHMSGDIQVSKPAATSAHARSLSHASQRVLHYVQGSVKVVTHPSPAPLDQAQQSVVDYLHAHGIDTQRHDVAPWDQATAAVRAYLRAHSR